MNDPSDHIGLRYPNHDAYSKPKSQPRTWHDQRADPNNRRVRFLYLERRCTHVCVPAVPARPRREIKRAMGAEAEEEFAAAATRRNAMALGFGFSCSV
jgi:hypothetical protein